MFCDSCGQAVPENATFCSNCATHSKPSLSRSTTTQTTGCDAMTPTPLLHRDRFGGIVRPIDAIEPSLRTAKQMGVRDSHHS
jgi:hypothetical protein